MAQFANPQDQLSPKGGLHMVQKCHGLKFQSVLFPDRFIACLLSPVAAKTHDARQLQDSGLLDQLEEIMPCDGG